MTLRSHCLQARTVARAPVGSVRPQVSPLVVDRCEYSIIKVHMTA